MSRVWVLVSHKMAEIPMIIYLALKKNLAKMAVPTPIDQTALSTQ